MAKGTLRVQTFSARYAAPIPDVEIVVTSDDFTTQIITDENGDTALLEIEAPGVNLSLDINNTEVLPYAVCNITAYKEGYEVVVIENVQIFAFQTTLAPLQLIPVSQEVEIVDDDDFVIPVHSLFTGMGGSGPSPIDDGIDPAVLQEVIIPTNVVVHLGTPNSSARNVTVPFRDYIANVASSEIYPTWPEQAIRANIHCQISVALNRIYTEWYRSRGYNFTITSSPSYDQNFVYGRTLSDTMERITDDIFNTYVRKIGTRNPFYTEYCDGRIVNCPGLKQWGTVTLANAGRNALQILQNYYNNDVEIVRTNNIQAIEESYPGSPVEQGDSGTNVYILQRQLNRITQDYPSFGKLTVDGVFGSSMKQTVERFQRQFNLTADGVVGRQTWYKISYIYISVKELAQLTSEGEESTGGNLSEGEFGGATLQVGSRGAAVEQMQFWLATLARYNDDLIAPSVDGVFGTGTETAVKAFQREFGLTADGLVGKVTWDKLFEEYEDIGGDTGAGNTYPGTAVRVGDRGDEVKQVQFWLRIAKTNYSVLNNVTVDGVFGTGTETAVKKFQDYFGLADDGVVGRATWDKLYTVYLDITNDLVPPNSRPGDFPGTLRVGSSGTAVRELQYYLFIMAAYEPSIPTLTIDGRFGTGTRNSVVAFQRFADITADGVVGPVTWEKLYNSANRLRRSGSTVKIKEMSYPGDEIKLGDVGESVEYYAVLLQRIAFYYEVVEKPDKTIFYDETLVEATKSFQQLVSLPQTGVVDKTTWNKAEKLSTNLLANAEPTADLTETDEHPGYSIKLGSVGAVVRKVQAWLNDYARLFIGVAFVEENGIFGLDEKTLVITVQTDNNLSPHGAVDKDTWEVLRDRRMGG